MKKASLITALFLVVPFISSAAEWKIIPEQSKIEFRATQNASIISGSFKKFSGKINFDPAQLKTSKVEIEIDMSSVEASLSDAVETLKKPDWLSIKIFPKATFFTDKFTKISDKKFSAEGKLVIKDKSVPTKLEFALEEYSPSKARAVGSLAIKRSDFAIGAKDPTNAHGVKDEVTVAFVIAAVK